MARGSCRPPSLIPTNVGAGSKRKIISRSQKGPQTPGPAETTGRVDEDRPHLEEGVARVAEHKCVQCQRVCTSKTGLGVHRRRAHTEEYNEALMLPQRKVRWSNEKREVMATLEALASIKNVKGMNDHLVPLIPGRTRVH